MKQIQQHLEPAPTLRDTHGQSWSWPYISSPDPLLDSPGARRAWLFFLPGAFTPVCTNELVELPELARQLAEQYQTGLRVIATDSVAVLAQLEIDQPELATELVPLLSDFWPHGAASRSFAVFDEESGHPLRHSVLVEQSGELDPTPGTVRVLARLESDADTARSIDQHLTLSRSTL